MKKIYYFILIILELIITYRYIDLHYFKHEKYYEDFLSITNKIVYGLPAPRGRILDRNGKVLVDNETINTITYHKLNDINSFDVATYLIELIDIEEADTNKLIKYYMLNNDTDYLLTKEEIDYFISSLVNSILFSFLLIISFIILSPL